jgi:peptidoglycan/xylan/chitin deacetylase (PgdA/CDA1 family)
MSLLSLRVKRGLKKALPYLQLLEFYHRFRNRNTLTIVVFHRVLAVDDDRWVDAHPEWVVSDVVFDQCLRFFRRYYQVISLEELFSSLNENVRLPSRSLLITFDDGYADNEEYALPLLKRHQLPAVLFVTSDFINRKSRPWTEDLMAAFRQGDVSPQSLSKLHGALFNSSHAAPQEPLKQLGEICARFPDLSDREVEELCSVALGKPLKRLTNPAQMLSEEQLRRLYAAGVAIGAHGKTHTSLPLSNNLSAELREPRRAITGLLNLESVDEVVALAFPFGDYSEGVVSSAFTEGYKLLFTFKPAITRLSHGRLSSFVLDRVNVSGPTIASDGNATPERLARCLFFVPHGIGAV